MSHSPRTRVALRALAAAALLLAALPGAGSPAAEETGPAPAAPAEPARTPEAGTRIEWFPWSEEPFLRAQALDRPVLLVVSVRWSRQAARFFEDSLGRKDVARVIAESWVPVLADADLRPDVAQRYPGPSWPAITLLTPLGDPIYYRPERKGAPPIRMTLRSSEPEALAAFLRDAARYYRTTTRKGAEAAGFFRAALAEETKTEKKVGPVRQSDLRVVRDLIVNNVDAVNGGFGRAPKFLMRSTVEASLMLNRFQPDGALMHAAESSLAGVAKLIDPVEGGVHRLAAAENWTDISYEKLLDRNAEALEVFADAFRTTGSRAHLDAARGIAAYIQGPLSLKDGGFSYAQLADMSSRDGGDYYRAPAEKRSSLSAPAVLPASLTAPTARAARALMRYAAVAGDHGARLRALAALDHLDEKVYARGRGVQHAWDGRMVLGPLMLRDHLAFIVAHLEAFDQTGRRVHLDTALDAARFVRANLRDPESALLMDRIPQAGGPLLMQTPVTPYEENCEAARIFARLHYLTRAEGKTGPGPGEFAPPEPGQAAPAVPRERWNEAARDLLAGMAGRFAETGPRAADYALALAEYFESPTWIVFLGDPDAGPDSRRMLDAGLRLDLPFRLTQILDPRTDLEMIRAIGLVRAAPPAVYLSREGVTTNPAVTASGVEELFQSLLAGTESPRWKPPEEAGAPPSAPGR